MKNIKGPKSALSDFIKESNIKVGNKRKELDLIVPKVEIKKSKKSVKFSKPFEFVNAEIPFNAEKDQIYTKFLQEIEQYDLNNSLHKNQSNESNVSNELDESLNKIRKNDKKIYDPLFLNEFAMFLSKNRKMNAFLFNFLVKHSVDKLFIYDCSMIKDFEFVILKDLTSLELYQCGQLSEDSLNCILSQMAGLKTLKITGAFLLENFNIPTTLSVLDVSNCSRLKNQFIENLNSNRSMSLEELRLSFCYGLTDEAVLEIQVSNLFICETRLTERFYSNLTKLKSLSVKRCPKINSIPELNLFEQLEYLDVEGIVTLKALPSSENLLHLNITDCFQIKELYFLNLKYLNLNNCQIDQNTVDQILKMKSLKELNVSWNTFVDDGIFSRFVSELNLEMIVVFGCFGLTKRSVDFAYKNKNLIKVIGNPSETKYLLEE
jgi:hypothetical protein